MKKIFIINTSLVSIDDLKARFSDNGKGIKLQNIIDDSLLAEVSTVGKITPAIISRMTDYFRIAESQGADLIFNQCSSVGIAAEIAAQSVNIPVLRIDDAMAEKAVSAGNRIALIATVSSTVVPSSKIIKDKAALLNKEITLDTFLIDGALNLLMEGQVEEHDKKVIEQILAVDGKYDVIVLAQGSMVKLLPKVPELESLLLSSPELGVQKAIDLVNTL